MARLETQINQIFISPTDSKKISLILFEEKINASQHLFLLAELRGIQKRTEINDLGKISEIIIESFKSAKKLPAEAMFENTLAEINQKLADFAHKGRKSWLGKFSALVALKAEKDFYLANSGHTCVWLKRKNSLNEILSTEKTETHPLKSFSNFSSGRMVDGDNLVLATSSIFNYISVELFSKTLSSNSLQDACLKISGILKASAKSDEGFAVFLLGLSKDAVVAAAPPEQPKAKPAAAAPKKTPAKIKKPALATPHAVAPPVYAPMPEDLYPEPEKANAGNNSLIPAMPKLKMPSVPKLKLPSFPKFKLPAFKFLPNVSGPAKFFFASFLLFAVLFAMNIVAYGVRKAQSQENEKFNTIAEALVNYMADAESALLYKNQSQAMESMSAAETELHKLEQLDESKVPPFRAKFDEMNNKINRVTVLRNLTPVFETPFPVTFMARAGSGFLVSNENPNSIGIYDGSSLETIFMLNKTDGDIKGIAHVSGQGNFLATQNKIYFANATQQEFVQMNYLSNADYAALKFLGPNQLYVINKTTNQVVRMNASANSVSGVTNLLRSNTNLQFARDLAVDTDIYVLFSDQVKKFVRGAEANFQLSPLSEPVHELTRIRVGNQIYLLEPIAKRVLIYSKNGELLNQVKFPELEELNDLYVDEGAREMHLLNGNKIYRITF